MRWLVNRWDQECDGDRWSGKANDFAREWRNHAGQNPCFWVHDRPAVSRTGVAIESISRAPANDRLFRAALLRASNDQLWRYPSYRWMAVDMALEKARVVHHSSGSAAVATLTQDYDHFFPGRSGLASARVNGLEIRISHGKFHGGRRATRVMAGESTHVVAYHDSCRGLILGPCRARHILHDVCSLEVRISKGLRSAAASAGRFSFRYPAVAGTAMNRKLDDIAGANRRTCHHRQPGLHLAICAKSDAEGRLIGFRHIAEDRRQNVLLAGERA